MHGIIKKYIFLYNSSTCAQNAVHMGVLVIQTYVQKIVNSKYLKHCTPEDQQYSNEPKKWSPIFLIYL